MKKLMFSLALACGIAAAYAEPTTLSGNTYRIQDKADATYTVQSVFEEGWPSGLPAPSFRFDCQQTNGWEFATDDQGRLRVAKIPSLVGERFLTTNQWESGVRIPNWNQLMPIYVAADPELSNLPMIDLADGKSMNSQIGLNFNAVYEHEGDVVKTNLLSNIGTVIAVYGSKLGGGDFLGGGRDNGTGAPKELWRRNRVKTLSDKNPDTTQVDYPATMLNTSYAPLVYGTARHFGLDSAPFNSGFAGTWEVLSMCPTGNVVSATGIGLGGLDAYYHSGGMQIAEMIFFTEVLDKADVAKVERYLARKWFPDRREDDGYNGRTSLGWYRSNLKGSSLKTTFEVPADETLEIGKLQGGCKVGVTEPTVVKAGAGTLEVGDFADYSGTVESQGGTVAFRKKAVPTLDQLADDMYVHFAADEAAYIETEQGEDGTNYVTALKNLASGTSVGLPVVACQTTVEYRPWIREKGIGDKPVIDFGLKCEGASGRTLRWGRGAAAPYTLITFPCFYTVVALVGAQNGGGHLMDNMMQRSTRWCGGTGLWSEYTSSGYWRSFGLLEKENTYGTYLKLNATNGTAYVNGRKLSAYTQGYETPNYQVAAWRVPGFYSYRLGGEGEGSSVHGQFRLGEIMIWLRPLSDEELMDAQAYLAKKWLGKTLAGYKDDAKMGVAQIQKLKVTGETTIDVPADAAARVGSVSLEADLVKTGAGTLYVAEEENAKYNLVVKEGAVKVLEPQVTQQCQMAAGPSLHLDATDENGFIFWPKNGTNFVHRWMSMDAIGSAYMSAAASSSGAGGDPNAGPEQNNPWLDTVNTLNGKPCVNFGKPHYSWGRKTPMMYLDHAHDGVRSVFVVLGLQNGGNDLFGGCATEFDGSSDGTYDWACKSDGTKCTSLFYGAHANIVNGEIRVDGVLTNKYVCPPDWALVEVHTLGGVEIASLNCQQSGTYNRGGNRYCEIIVYERELSEREKVATRNYLTKKWFPSRALEELPEAVAEKAAPLKAYLAEAGETNVVDSAVAEMGTLEGAGTVAKDSEGTLKVGDISGFEGTLDVRAGTVEVTLPPATNDVALVEDGRIIHLDAQDDSTLTHVTESSTGRDTISRWASKVGGFYAIPQMHCNSAAVTNMPYYLVHDLNGYPIVNMYSESAWNGRKCSMGFVDENGAAVKISKIRTAFWVLGSQEGGGLLFGGCSTNGVALPFYRNTKTGSGQDSGTDYRQGLVGYLATCYWPYLSAASYWVNGVKTAGYGTPNVLSGEYDLVAMRAKEGVADDKTVTTSGLAFHTEKEGDRGYRGRQRLGELIVYDRVLTDEEMAQMEVYLRAKWGYTQRSNVNDATVNLAAGATLVTTGNQYVATLKGAGTVDGDATVKNFTADGSAEGFAVDGTLTVAAGATITLENLPAITETTTVTVATAGAIDGANLEDVTIYGVPDKCRAKAKVVGNALVVTLKPIRGLVMIIQ